MFENLTINQYLIPNIFERDFVDENGIKNGYKYFEFWAMWSKRQSPLNK